MPLSNEQTIREAAIKTAEYLYGVEGGTFQGEVEAIGQLRQLINEEFVGKNKTVSSQLIYDMMHPFITRYGLEREKAGIKNYRSDIVQLPHHQATINADDRITEITNELEALERK